MAVFFSFSMVRSMNPALFTMQSTLAEVAANAVTIIAQYAEPFGKVIALEPPN